MQLLERAIRFVEWRRETPFGLDGVATACGVSRHHLARVFQNATGRPLIACARGRRLTEAARRLAAGEGDILTVALDAGYGPHEAFTRAFRAEFGLTPDAVRRAGDPSTFPHGDLCQGRHHRCRPRAGPICRARRLPRRGPFGRDRPRRLEHHPRALDAPRRVPRPHPRPGGRQSLRLCLAGDGERFTNLAGVEVERPEDVPREIERVAVPAARHAVVTHRGHVTGIRASMHAIFSRWLPESGLRPARAPDFEFYHAAFGPGSADDVVEIWAPVERA